MKRLYPVVTLLILTVSFPIGAGAQPAPPNLALNIEDQGGSPSAPQTWAQIVQGAGVNLDGIVTSALGAGGSATYTAGVQTVLIYDPSVLSPIGPQPALPASNPFPLALLSPQTPVTFDIGSTPYSAIVYDAGTLTPNAFAAPVVFATYGFQVNPDAPVGTTTEVYYSSALLGATDLASATSVSDGQGSRTLVSYVDRAGAGTTFGSGIATINVIATPEAPSTWGIALCTLAALVRGLLSKPRLRGRRNEFLRCGPSAGRRNEFLRCGPSAACLSGPRPSDTIATDIVGRFYSIRLDLRRAALATLFGLAVCLAAGPACAQRGLAPALRARPIPRVRARAAIDTTTSIGILDPRISLFVSTRPPWPDPNQSTILCGMAGQIVFSFTGTTLQMWLEQFAGYSNPFSISIDGGAAQTVTIPSGAMSLVTLASGLADSLHNVVITFVNDSTAYTLTSGIESLVATGAAPGFSTTQGYGTVLPFVTQDANSTIMPWLNMEPGNSPAANCAYVYTGGCENYMGIDLTATYGCYRLRATCSTLGFWVFDQDYSNGTPYTLTVDGVPYASGRLPLDNLWSLLNFTGLDPTTEHEYCLYYMNPVIDRDLISFGVMATGGSGVDTTPLAVRPTWFIIPDDISSGTNLDDLTDGYWFKLALANNVALMFQADLGAQILDQYFLNYEIPNLAALSSPPVRTFLQVGYYDCQQGHSAAQIQSDMQKLIGLVLQGAPNTKIYVCGLLDTSTTPQTPRAAGNAALQAAAAASGSQVVYASVEGFLNPADTFDGLHPDASGCEAIYEAYQFAGAPAVPTAPILPLFGLSAPATSLTGAAAPIAVTPTPTGYLFGPFSALLTDNGGQGSPHSASLSFPGASLAPQIVSYTDPAAETVTFSATGSPADFPQPASISVTFVQPALTGSITLQGLSPSAPAQTVTFECVPQSGTAITTTAAIDASGAYVLTGVPAGSYTVKAKGAKWLQRDAKVTIASGSAASLSLLLPAGDVNGDNVVDLSDFSELATAFGSSAGESNWDPNADLNCDGVVDMTDFGLLAANFGQQGDL
jgi:hypothetical protein